MQIIIEKDYEAMSRRTADVIVDTIINNPSATLCLAAGDTPRLAYSLAAKRINSEQIDVTSCKFVSLDEWIGISDNNDGSCGYFLRTVLFDPLRITNQQVHVFDGLANNLLAECGAMDEFIFNNGGIDLIVVGIGRNGHVGFNEPGVSFDHYSHVVELDATTKTVGQKYFRETTALNQGITLGLKHLLESRQAVLIANGTAKAEVIHLSLDEEISTAMPASIIQNHQNALVIVDEEAASLLKTRRS